jgi:hypothetical protein
MLMKLNRLIAYGLAAFLTTAANLLGSTLALDFSGGGSDRAINGMAGWRFRTNAEIQVDSIGLWDSGSDGFNTAHKVGIWTDSGDLLGSVTIKAGTASALSNRFRFEPVTPITLAANAVYRIASQLTISPSLTSATADAILSGHATVSTAAEMPYLDRAFANGMTFQFPSGFNSIDPGANFGPTFTFSEVPEPTPRMLCLIFLSLTAFRAGRTYR